MSTDDEDDQAVTYVPETPLSSESGQTPLSSGSGRSTSVEDVIEVHFVGVSFEYTIPHFPCISFPLRQIKFKPLVGSIQTYDGFIRDDPCLDPDAVYPRTIDVLESCIVKVEEFCKSAPAHHLQHPDEGIYLVWKWEWASANETLELFDTEVTEVSQQDDREVQNTNSSILDTVRFKVIGATRDKNYQHTLEIANEMMRSGKDVYFSLNKEPQNPVDSRAIAFICYVEGEWQRVGYVVRELLDEVHEAMSTNSIRDIKLAWVKFRIDFQASGPGFYAAVDITRIGRWSTTAYASASTN